MAAIPSAVVAVRDEREGGDGRRQRLAADQQLDGRAGLGRGRLDVAQRERAADAGPEAAAGEGAYLAAAGQHGCPLARRRLALGIQADELARRSLGELADDHASPREVR